MLECPQSRKPGDFFAPIELFRTHHNERRNKEIFRYIHENVSANEVTSLLRSMENDLVDVGMVEVSNDVLKAYGLRPYSDPFVWLV